MQFQSIEWQKYFTHDCKSSKICKLAFANIQGKDELIKHHFDKNIMKKTEDYIKPVVLDAPEVTEREINDIKERYLNDKDLEKKLQKLLKK